MAILRFRNQNAEQLKEQAREKYQAQVEHNILQKSGQAVVDPPPGSELLGTWTYTEVSLIEKPKYELVETMYSNLVIQSMFSLSWLFWL